MKTVVNVIAVVSITSALVITITFVCVDEIGKLRRTRKMTESYRRRRKLLKTVLKKHKKQLRKIAENNTTRDSNGRIVITKDDVWRED